MSSGFALLECLHRVVGLMQGNAALSSSVGGRIYDVPPQHTTFPFVCLAEQSASDWGTKDTDGQEIDLSIEVWSTYEGRLEGLTIAKMVNDILHRLQFVTDNFHHLLTRIGSVETTVDGDGATRRVRLRFRVLSLALPSESEHGSPVISYDASYDFTYDGQRLTRIMYDEGVFTHTLTNPGSDLDAVMDVTFRLRGSFERVSYVGGTDPTGTGSINVGGTPTDLFNDVITLTGCGLAWVINAKPVGGLVVGPLDVTWTVTGVHPGDTLTITFESTEGNSSAIAVAHPEDVPATLPPDDDSRFPLMINTTSLPIAPYVQLDIIEKVLANPSTTLPIPYDQPLTS
ncbi:hypothetical protein [Caudoviricetes sp.]|nr:hypothetical protein [Caudoviricetes sp.]